MRHAVDAAEKPTLTPEYLEDHGTYYYAGVFPGNSVRPQRQTELESAFGGMTISSVPEDIDRLREILLNFSHTIPREREMMKLFDADNIEHAGIPDRSAIWTDGFEVLSSEKKLVAAKQTREVNACHDMADRFRELDLVCEDRWAQELMRNLFKHYREVRPRHERRQNEYMYEHWQIARGLHWTEAPNLQSFSKRKVPYPDLTYGFPVHNARELREARLLNGSLESDGIANFSLTWHKELRDRGIITSPSTCLAKDQPGKTSSPRMEHRICFPWAVVEFKRDEDPESPNLRAVTRRCYCQVANGAAAALALQQPLLNDLWGSAANAYLYPVIAFTCIGPDVKTWLAYRRCENDATFTDTVCIYETNITTIWGCYSMHLIIENMHEWVSNQLRPELVKRLARHRSDGPYPKLQSALPPSPVKTRFDIPEIVPPQSEYVPRGRDINTAAPRAASESPPAARNQRQRASPPVEVRLAGLTMSDDEGSGQLDRLAAEDSGIGGISSDEDDEQLYPEYTPKDKFRVAKKIICRQMDPQPGHPNGAGYFLMEYRDSLGHRWLTAQRVGRNHAKLRDEYFAMAKTRRRRS